MNSRDYKDHSPKKDPNSDTNKQNAAQNQHELAQLLLSMRQDWESDKSLETPLNTRLSQTLFSRIKGAIQTPQVKASYQQPWFRMAAAAVVVLGLGLSVWMGMWQTSGEAEMLTYRTDYGEQTPLSLPDGSQVVLNANATLRVAKTWKAGETRQVWLEGEAYFDVADRHEAGVKFQVLTDQLSVEVLGTQFNVNTHANKTQVYLEEGKIQLLTHTDSAVVEMQPGELLTYSHQKKEIVAHEKQEAGHHLSWLKGVLLFERTPMPEVLDRVGEVYGLDIYVEDSSIYQRVINMGIPADNLDLALSFMRKSMGVKIIQEGDTLKIYKNKR